MKKLPIVAALLAAATLSTVSTSASALDTRVIRSIRAVNFPVQNVLGVLNFTPISSAGANCLYLTNWMSPFNPNEVTLCVLQELKSPQYPSCALNSVMDITSVVSAGPGGLCTGCATPCAGFNTLGIAFPDVTILAGEFNVEPVLQGTAIFPMPISLIYAIAVA